MITITKNGNAVLFEFEENQHYLYNGTIEVPLNSLSLVTDESEMFTFKKAATNDIFISARYDDVNMSKSQLIDFYIANMVGGTGGGSESGITSGDVESMIEASLQDYYDIDEIDAALSGKADSSAVTEAITSAVSGKADTSAVTEAINSAVSGKADSSAVTEAITAAVSGKADTSAITTSITSASTDTQVPSAKAVYDSNPWFILQNPNNSNRGVVSKLAEYYDTNIGQQAYIFGSGNPWSTQPIMAIADYSYAFGLQTSAMTHGAVAEGRETLASGMYSHSEGVAVKATNIAEHSQGRYNVSNSASPGTFGNSGNTLFSVGNGTADNARHNAFEIRQNGDIYLTKDGQDVKLQDQLGGGGSSYTAGDGIDITNDVISVTGKVETSAFTSYSAATDARISEDEEVTSAALNALNDGKQDTLIAGSGITISGNVISAEGGNLVIELTQAEYDALVDKDPNAFYIITDAQEINISDYYTSAQTQSAINAAVSGKQDTLIAGSGITISGNVISANGGGGSITVDTALDSGSTNPVENRVIYDKFDEVEEVTAAALNALNDRVDAIDITVDDALDATSENPVQNKVIYAVIGDIESLLSNI